MAAQSDSHPSSALFGYRIFLSLMQTVRLHIRPAPRGSFFACCTASVPRTRVSARGDEQGALMAEYQRRAYSYSLQAGRASLRV